MSQTSIRDPGPIVDQIIKIAQKYDIYKGGFKSDIDGLRSSITFSSPELRNSIHFHGKLFELMSNYFPHPPTEANSGYYNEFKAVIQGQ